MSTASELDLNWKISSSPPGRRGSPRPTNLQSSPATKVSSPSVVLAASPVNAVLRAAMAPAEVVLAVAATVGVARRAGGSKFGGGERRGGFRGDDRRDEPRERPTPPAPLPEFNVAFIPEERGVEQLARQIKVTGRAYPLFQIALLILDKAERYSVQLTKKKAGDVAQPLFVCALDDSPWTSDEEAVAHVFKNHFATFYQAERTATEPPRAFIRSSRNAV